MSSITIIRILTVFAYGAVAAGGSNISIHISGEESIPNIRAIIEDDAAFISLDDVLERLGITIKEVGDEIIGLCKEELCIIVQLGSEKDVRRESEQLMVNADLIAQTLSSKVEWLVSGKVLRFAPEDQVAFDNVVKAGDVLPNFVLPSISDGKMIPFSSFRGKRVLLFLWASW